MLARRLWLAIAFLGFFSASAQGQLYYYGDLYVYEDGAQAWTLAHLPYSWLYMTLGLYRNSSQVAYASDQGADTVSIWLSNEGCLPPYTWYVADGYVEGYSEYYEDWFYGQFWEDDRTPGSSVNVDSASIPADNIQVTLSPCGGYGPLTLQVEGDMTHTIFQGDRGGGSHSFSFDIDNLPNDREFTLVRATWEPYFSPAESGTLQYHFKVLGDYNHTQYNTPDHNLNCSGPMVPFTYINEPTCWAIDCPSAQTASDQALNGWLDEVRENGTGLHPTLGIMWGEPQCISRARYRRTGRTCPACLALGELVPFQDVAICLSHLDLNCGDTVYVHGVGTRIVKDRGGRVGPNQLDHYIGITGCNVYTHYGNKKTIKLY